MASMREQFEELHQAAEQLRAAPVWELKGRAEKVQRLIEGLLLSLIEEIEGLIDGKR